MYLKRCVGLSTGIFLLMSIIACSDDDSKPEPDTEVITEVSLLFSPYSGGAPSLFYATDPDEDGENLQSEEPIILNANTTYDLFIELEGGNQDLTNEIKEEAEEHMFFFEFTEGLFQTPQGNGNVDERAPNAVIYMDQDSLSLPIGLITTWAVGGPSVGFFRVILKHQEGGLKSATSTVNDGADDLDVTWDIIIE